MIYHPYIKETMNKTVLCIIDGLGENPSDFGNAVKAANMKNLEWARANFPSTLIKASGPEVGLVDLKDPGNSEVGHNAIGSGQYIRQGLALLNEKCESGDLFENETWAKLSANAKKTKLNVIQLLSDGRLHSDMYKHLFPVIEQCAKENIKLSIHGLVDGRDVPTQSAMKYLNDVWDYIKKCGANAKLATVAGRSVLWMDRYENLPALLTNAVRVCAMGDTSISTVTKDVESAINAEYKKRPTMTDETMPAFILEPDWLIKNGDSVLLLNYRGDRAVQICEMFEQGKYLDANQRKVIDKCLFFGALQYDAEKNLPAKYLCSPPVIKNTLSEWLCKHNVRQYTVTETVKFGHMTYFFNGNKIKPFDDKYEVWKEFPSDKCANMYNEAPAMQAHKITHDAIEKIKGGKFDFIKLNICNPDMVGHTGDFDATVIGCKTIDECLSKLIETCKTEKANLIITADHGSAEFMLYENGKPMSSHTNSPVPFILLPFALCGKTCALDHACKKVSIKSGEYGLTNLAATICLLLGIEISPHFNESII